MNKYHLFISLILTLTLSGCSALNKAIHQMTKGHEVTYDSVPRGAALFCSGIEKGATPTTLNYKITAKEKEAGVVQTQDCEARWLSGARADYGSTWLLDDFPYGVRTTAKRPNHEGYQIDIEFARTKELQRAQEELGRIQRKQVIANAVKNQAEGNIAVFKSLMTK